jgi:site-specific DNA-methyltransferase (adenine-specific)
LSDRVSILHGDCVEVMAAMDAASVDAIVTDPPAGIAFMGQAWDRDRGGRSAWCAWMQGVAEAALRVTKPGAHALVWSIPRTSHWTATAWEDAGWEVRDRLSHIFGSGFPKSLDVSKAIDRAAGAERCVTGQWQGWGTALKPAVEDWWVLRKPFSGTVAANVQEYGTGGLNIDGCRIETDAPTVRPPLSTNKHAGWQRPWQNDPAARAKMEAARQQAHEKRDNIGRWPANLLLDEASAALLDEMSGEVGGGYGRRGSGKPRKSTWGDGASGFVNDGTPCGFGDSGGASRFFYTSKASRAERKGSKHPAVKPLDLMRWLVRLVTPPGGTVLDPFAGSGTTGEAALIEGMRCVLIEREAEYVADVERRLREVQIGLQL